MLIVLMKYPRFRLSVFDKQEDGRISALRVYCQSPNFPDPQIKGICSNLAHEQNSQQGDQKGFVSEPAFSLHIFSASMLLKLREEYGLFYMCLELTMNAAVEIPAIESGSILNWYYVGPTAFYCFLLIIVRCYYHSSDEVSRRGGNGDDDNDGDGGDDGDRRPSVFGDELRQPDLELNQQADGDDGAEDGGGGGITGDQGCRTDVGSVGSSWEIVLADEGDEHNSERDVGKLSGENVRILSTSNVHGRNFTMMMKSVSLFSIFVTCCLTAGQVLTQETDFLSVFCVFFLMSFLLVFVSAWTADNPHIWNLVSTTCLWMYGSIWFEYYFLTYTTTAVIIMITSTLCWKEIWITCKRISNSCFGWCVVVFEFGLGFITRLLRQLGLKQNQEGDGHDGAEGGVDQGDSSGTDGEIVFAEEGDEDKAESAEGASSFDEIERITSTSNVPGATVITRRKHSVPSDQEEFPATTDGKSAATSGTKSLGKSILKTRVGRELF